MQLTALVESVDHVCCRYRLAAFGPALERAGHALELKLQLLSPTGLLAAERTLAWPRHLP